jgi:hypothetical protein
VFNGGWDFVITGGDMVDNSRNLAQYRYYLDGMGSQWGNTTQAAAIGNHEVYLYEKPPAATSPIEDVQFYLTAEGLNQSAYNYHLMHFNPANPATAPGWFSFDYSGVHFTFLDTNTLAIEYGIHGMRLEAKQEEWLKADLQGTGKIKVVVMHAGLYSAGPHASSADVACLRTYLTPMFYDYGVSVVFSGHDHTYTESFYIDGDGFAVNTDPAGSQKIGGEGVLYITLGAFGDKFYDYDDEKYDYAIGADDLNLLEFGRSLHNPQLQNPTFGKLYYDGKDLYYIGYQYNLTTGKIEELRALGKPESKEPKGWMLVLIAVLGGVVCALGIAAVAMSIGLKRIKSKRSAKEETMTGESQDSYGFVAEATENEVKIGKEEVKEKPAQPEEILESAPPEESESREETEKDEE